VVQVDKTVDLWKSRHDPIPGHDQLYLSYESARDVIECVRPVLPEYVAWLMLTSCTASTVVAFLFMSSIVGLYAA
jgi:hypothetical protein